MLSLIVLILLAMFVLIGFSYVVLRAVFTLAGIFIMGIIVLIPFLWIVHPWFELLIIVLLVVMILQRQSREV